MVQFLIDTGCTTNLLAKHVFDKLSPRVKIGLEECHSNGAMADGTQLPFYGVLKLPTRLRGLQTEETFVISRISEDAILGMPFLTTHNCTMEFENATLSISGKELRCTDRYGRLLTNNVQVVRNVTIPARTEMAILGRVTSRNYSPIGLVEGRPEGPLIATSVNMPNEKGKVVVRCLNPTEQPLIIPSGTTIGTYSAVKKADIQDESST